MGSQEMPNQGNNRGLVLSVDAKPRLKWTRQLHECFADAVSQLGGADKATPKSLMRTMGVPGLTLYHLKSHLQKYRLAKNRDTNTANDDRKEDCEAANNKTVENEAVHIDEGKTPAQFNGTMLQMQIEVQRKLQEQIEVRSDDTYSHLIQPKFFSNGGLEWLLQVQRHLQLRIEAQGKYLQSVLRKAHETLASCSSNSLGVEAAKAELSELLSAVETECLSSSLSRGSLIPKRAELADCSTDSCLTSSLGRQEAKIQKQWKLERSSSLDNWSEGSEEINPNSRKTIETQANNKLSGAKRSCSSIHGEASVKKPAIGMQETNSFGVPRGLDLNR
ncbi:myb-related protein 2-like isoform X1 [Phoenix dactylifera]|uniref:Myb-related protein 2-like isoform X1 n=1 Tax=Phoenix dactylifera TaxID=42345 RepID=A0A8B8J2J9_PHODC|nr:myb-related protein 2-like isoform X1 [Phoenix dactylifera]XP_026658864.2 myb-related protein 2-like isoform X1 [Phoenix dactylifera]